MLKKIGKILGVILLLFFITAFALRSYFKGILIDKVKQTINEEVNAKYTKLDFDYKYNDRNDPERIYYRSDHYNFAKKGIPSIFFFNGVHADYHLPSDTPDKIEYDALAKRAQLAFGLAWELANRPERIKVDRDGK